MAIDFDDHERGFTIRSSMLYGLFAMVVAFQLSVIKYTLGLGVLASIVNAAMLIGLSVLAVKNVSTGYYSLRMWLFFLLPVIFVAVGYALNIAFNLAVNPALVSSLGLIIPWVACLSLPFFIKNKSGSEAVWRFYYYCMLFVCVIGLLEFSLGLNGYLPLKSIETPLGDFLSGGMTILYGLDDGSPYYRFYSIFPEPGTLAMYLLPVIMYSLVYKKYFGLILFSIAMFFTDSLGGLVGALIIVAIFVYRMLSRTRLSIGLVVFTIFIAAAGFLALTFNGLKEAYLDKDQSKVVREENVANVIVKLPSLLMEYPFGFTLAEGSFSNIDSRDNFGSTFALGNAIMLGGIFSFLGYFFVLASCLIISIRSLMSRAYDLDGLVVFPSLLVALTFVFQRATVMDSALYSLLFAPSLIRYLQSTFEKNDSK